MDAKADSRVKHIDFIILDLLSIQFAFVLSVITRYGLNDFLAILRGSNAETTRAFRTVDVVLILAYLVIMLFAGPHTGIVKRGHIAEGWSVFVINMEMLFTLLAFLYVIKTSAIYSRLMLGYFLLYDVVIMMMFRTFRKLILRIKVLDGSDTAEEFVKTLTQNNSGFYHFKGIIFTDSFQGSEYMGIPVIKQKDMLDFVKENTINDVFMLTKAGGRLATNFINMGITVHRAMSLETPNMVNASINQLGNYIYNKPCDHG